jgi:hypothetical protein
MLGVDYDSESNHEAEEHFRLGFKRSRNGNLWQQWDGLTLSVFRRRRDGFFGWCIAGPDGQSYSPGGYAREQEAIGALWAVVSRGERGAT